MTSAFLPNASEQPSIDLSERLVLPQVMDMRSVRDLKRLLDVFYRQKQACTIDGYRVARISTGCAQILTAFFIAMASAGIAVTLHRPSAAMADSLRDLGLAAIFSLPPREA